MGRVGRWGWETILLDGVEVCGRLVVGGIVVCGIVVCGMVFGGMVVRCCVREECCGSSANSRVLGSQLNCESKWSWWFYLGSCGERG